MNFLDHNNIGESSIFIPVTFAESRIRGTEADHSLAAHLESRAGSPRLLESDRPGPGRRNRRLDHWFGAIRRDWGTLDHDQRNTLNVGSNVTLPWQAYFGANIYYGSGFSNGSQGIPGSPYQDPYLPGHAQIDLSLGQGIRRAISLSVTALNVANRHLLIDNSLTFGGFHYDNPREIYAEFRWRFNY